MYSNEDLERFYFKYQTEALPHGQSLQSFCLNNKVLTHSTQQLISFWKWFRCSNGSYSIISTVKLHGSSVWSYLGKFFKKIFEGCRDYPSLLPSCIGLEKSTISKFNRILNKVNRGRHWKELALLGEPKLTAYTPSYETSQNHRALWSWQSWQNAYPAHGHWQTQWRVHIIRH